MKATQKKQSYHKEIESMQQYSHETRMIKEDINRHNKKVLEMLLEASHSYTESITTYHRHYSCQLNLSTYMMTVIFQMLLPMKTVYHTAKTAVLYLSQDKI
jgi:Mg2+ and Co2+ transporter CorA